jgi:hypothetical protein
VNILLPVCIGYEERWKNEEKGSQFMHDIILLIDGEAVLSDET